MSSELIDQWQAWFRETFTRSDANFVTAERNGDNWDFRRFTHDPQTATITALQAELAEAREVPGRIVDWLNSQPETLHHDDVATAIEARDWSK